MAPLAADNPPLCNDSDEEESSFHDDVMYSQLSVVNLWSSSGSDSEEEWINGYELLPQEPENEQTILSEQVECSATEAVVGFDQSQLNDDGTEEHTDNNCAADQATNHSIMDQDHIEKIKAAMVGFTLPSSSIPSWANVIPEDQWKTQLLTLMNLRKECKSEPSCTNKDSTESNMSTPPLDVSKS